MNVTRGTSASTMTIAVIALSAALVAAAIAIPAGIGRAIVLLPVAALAPGWAVQTVAGRRGRGDVAIQLGLAVVLSLGVLIAIGLGLAAAGVRLTPRAETVTLAGLLAVLAVAAWSRRDRAQSAKGARYWRPWLAALAVLAVLGGTTGGLLAFGEHVGTRPLNDGPWTGLTLTGAAASGQTLSALPGGTVRLTAELTNRTGTAVASPATLSVDGRLHARASVRVGPSGREYVAFSVRAPRAVGFHRLQISANGQAVDAGLEVSR